MSRQQHTTVTGARGGCNRCAGAQWQGKNAMAQAARHHDKTTHPTWAEQTQRTEYGGAPAQSAQRSML
jgi:hypothetical protein